MKLSFIIPAYNEEQIIGRCVDSILAETKTIPAEQVEIVVVNNNSTDKTKEVAASYAQVKVVDETRKGIIFARQAGVLASSGNLLAHIDADTMLTKGWVKTVFNEFGQNPNLVALSGPYIYYDLSAITRLAVRIYYYLGYVVYLLNRFVFRHGSMLQGGNFIVAKSAWEKLGAYDKAFSFYGEDVDLARRLNAIGPVKFTFKLPMLTSGRRLKEEGALKSGAKYAANYFWVMLFGKPFTKNYSDIR